MLYHGDGGVWPAKSEPLSNKNHLKYSANILRTSNPCVDPDEVDANSVASNTKGIIGTLVYPQPPPISYCSVSTDGGRLCR